FPSRELFLKQQSTLSTGSITNSGTITLQQTAALASVTLTNNPTGAVIFKDTSTAAGATLVNSGVLDASLMTGPLQVGALSGAGAVKLGATQISIGALGQTNTISGIIQDGGVNGGIGGSLTKTGTGTLILTAANTY